MQEIIEFVNAEIKHAGFDHKKLIGGIVITGGGSQLVHLRSLFELVTGIPTRIGFAVEHLNKGMVEEVHHPSFATGTGLLIYGLKNDLTLPNEWEQSKDSSSQHKSGFTSKIKSWFESTFLGPID
jgi:cell division protein FtsA